MLLWKMDLKSAFAQMFFRPEYAHLLAFPLTEALSLINHIVGFFGWTGTPFAFEVITRVLRGLLRHIIDRLLKMYVDDLMAAARKQTIAADMLTVTERVQALLGPGAIAPANTEIGRALDFIGWRVDLDLRTVTMSPLNLSKTIFAFFSADVDTKLTLQELQGLASRASRCAAVCRNMRPYTVALHQAVTRSVANGHAKVSLSVAARVDVWMWRTFLALVNFDPERIARPLVSFKPAQPRWIICFDASLTGYGVALCRVPEDGATHREWETLVCYTALDVKFQLNKDSRFQNHSEFTAVVLGLLLMERAGCERGTYVLKGDSMSALRWAREDRAICFSVISLFLDVEVAETVHVPGIENVICDGLSRGLKGKDVGLPLDKFVDLASDSRVLDFLAECDPTLARRGARPRGVAGQSNGHPATPVAGGSRVGVGTWCVVDCECLSCVQPTILLHARLIEIHVFVQRT